MSVNQLIAQQVVELEPYESPDFDKGSTAVRLNANEYPQDCPMTVALSDMNRYPQAQSTLLKKAYADYAGLTPEQVLVCRGGDEAIEVLVRAFCTPGCDKILICPPTYAMYAISAQTANVGIARVPMIECAFDEAQIDAALSADASIKVLFLCNPNNPLTSTVTPQALESVVKTVAGRAIVVIDEAYIEFASALSCADFVNRYDNVAIVRTLSKAFALAGLRCGYVLADKRLISILRRVIAPYPTPVPVEVVAAQALSASGIAEMNKRVQIIEANRTYLMQALRNNPLIAEVYDSATNFILVKTRFAEEIFTALQTRDIYIRKPDIVDALRISVGTRQECEHLVAEMQELVRELNND